MIPRVLAPLALLLAAASVAADCVRNYTVRSGDICDGISHSQGVSTYQLASANTQTIDPTCSNLQPGQSLCLAWAGYDCTELATVQAQDSCQDILAAANINMTALLYNNPQIGQDCAGLYVGEVLCVSASAAVSPYPSGTPVPVNWDSTPTASGAQAVASYYSAADALAVGLIFSELPFCDEI